MYTIKDIQIFIVTHNRANLLSQSIETLLNQSEKINNITVLDNESEDNTEMVAKSYSDSGVKYIKTVGFLGNFKKAQELANNKFVMLFHDDDILHPDYFKVVLAILNKNPDTVEILSRYTEFKDVNVPKTLDKLNKKYFVFKNQKNFVEYMFFIECIGYASAIYKTSVFKKLDLEYEKYNKFNDWPFMAKFSKYGKIILLEDKNAYFVRRHSGQDTWTNTNVPSVEQVINWDKFFYDILFKKEDKFLRKVYAQKSTYFLNGKYNAFVSDDVKNVVSSDLFYEIAKESGLKITTDNTIINNFDKNLYIHYLEYIQVKFLKSDNMEIFLKKIKKHIKWIKAKYFEY